MQGDLSLLINLQQLDAAIDELREKTTAFDPLIQKKNQALEALKANLKSAKDALSSHQVKKKQLEMDVDAKEKLVQKHNGELNSLKSNDAYKAMLEEIKAAKEAVIKIEDEILLLMEAVDADDKKYKELEKKFKTDEGTVKSEIQAIESQKSAAVADVAKKQEERDIYAKTVPAALLTNYEVIREKAGGIAIVPMINSSCTGCHMKITTAKANEVKKAKETILCDSCSRILYVPQEVAAPAPATPDA